MMRQLECRRSYEHLEGSWGSQGQCSPSGKEVAWNLNVADTEKPWVLVVTPNESLSERKEIFGTAIKLPRID
jgi:hypothetical protein